jgi:teichuronic acid biosynthesis glycosyltransferase TuaC
MNPREDGLSKPNVLVFSSLFPNANTPHAGAFIRERLFRVGKHIPIVVVAPVAWSPFDWLIRFFRASFRPQAQAFEVMDGVEVYRPRVFSVPGILKQFDGQLMARGAQSTVAKLVRERNINLIDAHFLYPDGFAASTLARELQLPFVVTLRGSKDQRLLGSPQETKLKSVLQSAAQIICVSRALKIDVAEKLIGENEKTTLIGNGVDLNKFSPEDKSAARARLNIAQDATVIVSVGGLVEGKGFHRIIPLLPALKAKFPKLIFLIVGGGASHGDMTQALKDLAKSCGAEAYVRFCGSQLPSELRWFYSAADVFALATKYEGWANVFLEAMACGLPVVSTQVGGNAEVVPSADVGTLVPFFDAHAFEAALADALTKSWDREKIIAYAKNNGWDARVTQVIATFQKAVAQK